jgi:hypothetical protein
MPARPRGGRLHEATGNPGARGRRWEKWGPASRLASVNEERAIRRFGLLAYITALGQLRRGDPEHGGYTCSVSRMGS